jgi:phosphocarrier protein
VSTATIFSDEVYLEKYSNRINGNSIMGVMMLAASKGTSLTIITVGDDENAALKAVSTLIQDGFGETQ